MDSCASAVILRGCEKILRHPESAKRDEGSQNTTSLQFRDPSPSTRLRMTGFFTASESAKRDEGSQNATLAISRSFAVCAAQDDESCFQSDSQLIQLFLIHFARCLAHQILRACRLRERDHVAQRLGA